jgi:hypothetical protein
MPIPRVLRPLGLIAFTVAAAAAFLRPPTPRVAPSDIIETAIDRMGGQATLRKIERVRFEMMTAWHRMTFDDVPNDVVGSYELHSDLRNYALGAWRNTRRFVGGPTLREMTDVVQADAAIRRLPKPDGTLAPWTPLNIAYTDERKELFAFAPERLLLAARDARDLRALADTSLAGKPHARVSATVAGFPATIFVRRADGALTMARYRAGQPNDFGLSPWGEMEVEVWYARWNRYPLAGTTGVVYPTQWDVRRVGRPYKRLSVLAANFDAPAPADSFAISDSLRGAFAVTASRPMWDLPMDSARVIEQRFAHLGPLGPTTPAVKLGTRWLFLEGPVVPARAESDAKWLAAADPGSTVGGMLLTVADIGRGGAAWMAERKLPVYIAPGSAAAMAANLRNWKQRPSAATVVTNGQWLRMGGDSLWVEPIDYPDAPGALLAYVPSLRWVYSGVAAAPLNFDVLVERIRERGWAVDRVGSLRGLTQPLPPRSASR